MIQDLRFALRILARERWFSLVAVLTLALGIGANTAIFSLINTLMLRPLPVQEPRQLVQFMTEYPGDPRMNAFPWASYEHFRDQNRSFSDIMAAAPARFAVSRDGSEAQDADGEYVSGNFFSGLGVEPVAGRLLRPQDDQLGEDAAVAVLSWSYWGSRFASDPSIVGRQIIVNSVPVAVVGVAARRFTGVEVAARPDIWVPAAMEPVLQQASQRNARRFGVRLLARLKPDVSIEQAKAEMRVLARSHVEEMANTFKNPGWLKATIAVEPAGAGTSVLRESVGRPLLALMAMVAVLLLLTAVNIASLLLARGAARAREMAVRVAIGASWPRVCRQVLTESLLLSGGGALIGIAFAFAGANALVRILLSGRLMIGLPQQIQLDVQPDLRVLLFTAGVAVLTGVLFGLAPAWNASASAQITNLRDAGTVGERRSRRLVGRTLVVAQVALSVVMLSAAGLLVAHLSNLRNVNLGFDRTSVLLVSLDASRSGYERAQLSRLFRELLTRLETIPGVRSATLSGMTPISGAGGSVMINVEGFQERPEDRRFVSLNGVAPRYFETLGTPLLEGRDFSFTDGNGPAVAIVNQAFAQYYFGGRSALGRQFSLEGQTQRFEIIGVVANAKYLNLYEAPPRTFYLNAFQGRGGQSDFALRTDVEPMAVAADVRRVVSEVVRNVPIRTMRTLTEQVDASIVTERLIAVLSGAFGTVGALLAAIGLYGLLAYTVSRRTSEMGLRMALGATRGQVMAMVLRSAFGLVLGGLVIGLPLAVMSPRVLVRFMQGLTVQAPIPLLVAALAMIVVALLAAYVPARRAARVEPVEALRQS